MKKISKNERTINILKKAVENGFELDSNCVLDAVIVDAENYLIANTEHQEEECEVHSHGRSQSVNWSDGMGYEFLSSGEIVDFSANWSKSPDFKVIHNTVVDSEANVIDLYYLVGETDYNRELVKLVNKDDYEVHRYINGYFGICEIGKHGGNCVFGGDSANSDDYNEEYINSVYDSWNGELTYTGHKYGYKIEQ